MSIPVNASGEKISTIPVTAFYLEPDGEKTHPLFVKERGGIALNDPSEGINIIDWTLRYFPATGDMVIESETTPQTILFTLPDITEIDLTFDGNMNPFVAYVRDGDAWYWWYDSDIPGTVHTQLPTNSLTPRCTLDDKREDLEGASDIILCYVLNGNLEKRIQRQRFLTPEILVSPFIHPTLDLPAVIVKVGMHKGNRLQWTCDLANPIDWCGYVNHGN